MQVFDRKTADLIPYAKNPRRNDGAVDAVAESIQRFGFKVPIILDRDGVIVAGHTRLKAAKKLGLETVPCIIADDLTPEEIKAFRLADNKTAELAEWDFDMQAAELRDLADFDMSVFGFDMSAIGGGHRQHDWFNEHETGELTDEDSEEYAEFLEKFEAKRTTDDCYTPPIIYDAISAWVANEYSVDPALFVRPFYPGGDYKNEKYPPGCIVMDNPPFSILAEIVRFYRENGIRFFLFAPSLTIFSSSSSSSCAVVTGAPVTYENGAVVSTSFLTNMETGKRFRSAPDLYKAVKNANEENLRQSKTELPKYSYPDHVITSALIQRFSKYGVNFSATLAETERISALDAQKEYGKAIYGNGYLVSNQKAAEKAAAEKAAAEKAAAYRWALSDREKEIVRRLSGGTV